MSEWYEMGKIELNGAIPYNPRSAGVVEKGDSAMKESVRLVWMEEPDVGANLVAKACGYAKNITIGPRGFCALTRVFGRIPRELDDMMEMTPQGVAVRRGEADLGKMLGI